MVSTYIDYRIKTEIDKYGLQPEECKRKNNRKGMPVYRDHWDDGAFRTLAQQVSAYYGLVVRWSLICSSDLILLKWKIIKTGLQIPVKPELSYRS